MLRRPLVHPLAIGFTALFVAACSGKIDGTTVGTSSGGSSSGRSSTSSGAGGGSDPGSGWGGSSGVGGGGANGSGGGSSPGFPGGDPGSDLPGGGCFGTVMGPGPCSEKDGYAFCGGRGYLPVSMTDTPSGCQITCCTKDGPTPPPPTPTPSPCTWSAVGSGTTCLSFVEIATQAQAFCDAMGNNVQSLHPANDCAGGATIAKVECCPK